MGSVFVYQKDKICYFCEKKIHTWISWFDFGYYDWEISFSKEINGIRYHYVNKYWHKKCAWDNRPTYMETEDSNT